MTRSALDSNILIHLWRHNPIDVPMYSHIWLALNTAIAAGKIITQEVVLTEIEKGNDGLKTWVQTASGLIVPNCAATFRHVTSIMTACPDLGGIETERNHADPFIIACGIMESAMVVSNERPRNSPNERWKVPDACARFSVPWLDFKGFANHFPWI